MESNRLKRQAPSRTASVVSRSSSRNSPIGNPSSTPVLGAHRPLASLIRPSLHRTPNLPSTPLPRRGSVNLQPFSSPRLPSYSHLSGRNSATPGGLPSSPSVFGGVQRDASQDLRAFCDVPEEEDADVLHEVIMALEMKDNGTVGCAYYVALDEALFLQEDIPMAGMELIETLLIHVEPTTVIIANRAPESLRDFLEAGMQDVHGSNQGEMRGVWVLRSLGASEFNYDSAVNQLLNLDFASLGVQSMQFNTVAEDELDEVQTRGIRVGQRENKQMRLATLINLDSRLSIGCVGAVLNDIQRRKAAEYLPNDPQAIFAFRVRTIEMFTLSDSMFVNADALASLQILQCENHPNRMMQGPDKSNSSSKESLSIYGLFHFLAFTPQGKMKLRQMFLRPSINIDVIQERQKTISVLLLPENNAIIALISKTLRKIKNVRGAFAQLRKGVSLIAGRSSVRHSTWAILLRFASFAIELREMLQSLVGAESLVISTKLVNGIMERELRRVAEDISGVIDFEMSKDDGRTTIRSGVSANLDEMKRKFAGLGDFLNGVASHLTSEIPEWAQGYVRNCIFYPQLGFLTVVSENNNTGRGNYEGEGIANDMWERMFVTEGNVYFKNRRMRQLDEQIGDLYCMIVDKEIEILHELGVRVLELESQLTTASDLCGEFDCILALALGASKYNWACPKMTTLNIIDITGGRHPLQELVVPIFVPNDCCLMGGSDADDGGDESQSSVHPVQVPSMLVLTGPNHSGKSVYLKQVALIVYLAHIGSFVPAEEATIGLTDRLLTRIATRESVSRNESAFAIDLRQAAFSINFSTPRSLILIDEFGKGTNAVDGAGLITGLLDHFLSLDEGRPKVLAATHFHEIFENNLLQNHSQILLAHMEVRVDLESQETEDQVTYLYHLTPGRNNSSFGSICAAINGVDKAVVERAEAIILLLARGEDLQASCAQLSGHEAQKLEEAEAVARDFLKMGVAPLASIEDLARGEVREPVRDLLRQVLEGSSPDGI